MRLFANTDYTGGVAILINVLAILKYKRAGLLSGIILAFLWLWMGIVYHFIYFSQINPAAKFFGALFILQGLLFYLRQYSGRSLELNSTQT
jgi:hypothetical protein